MDMAFLVIYQELIDEDDYWEIRSDERVYLYVRARSGYTKEAEKLERNNSKINLHLQLKEATTKELRFRVSAHSLGEYLYILTKMALHLDIEHMLSISARKTC